MPAVPSARRVLSSPNLASFVIDDLTVNSNMLGVIGALIFVVGAESLKSSRSGQSLCAVGSLTLLVAEFDF